MSRSSRAGRRAVLRWAWRLFRREWRQQLLVIGLVTLAVAMCVGGSAFATNSATVGRGRFGNAGALVRLETEDHAKLQASIAGARERFGALEVIGHQSVAVPGSPERLDLRSQAPHGRFSSPMLGLVRGRYPTADDEIALTNAAAVRAATHLAARVTLGRATRTVVGLVENPGDLHDEFGVLAPSSVASAESVTLLVASAQSHNATNQRNTPPATSATPAVDGFQIEGAPRSDNAVAVSVLMITTVSLALVGLIAAAGFVVVAQRRQRQLGLLDAIGATERNLRLVTAANGMIVGAVAALTGGALGIVSWIVGAPALETGIGHRVDRWSLPWTLILSCLALAVVAGIAAAWWPARMMSRQATMSALSRRPARPAPIYRSLIAATVLLAGGGGLIVAAHPTAAQVSAVRLIFGLVAMIVGSVLITPGAVRLLALPASRLPFAPRLALRDLVRNQARAASALAAITLGLGISVAIVVLAQANRYHANEGNLSTNQLFVATGDVPTPAVAEPALRASEHARNDAAAKAIAAEVSKGTVVALDVAFNPVTAANADVGWPIAVVVKVNDHSFSDAGRGYVATPELLAQLGVNPATIEPSTELITSLKANVILLDTSVRPDGQDPSTNVQRVDSLGAFTSAPRSLITTKVMQSRGWVAERSAWLVVADKPLTASEISAARQTAANAGLTVEVRSTQDDLKSLRNGATVFGLVLALAIVAMTMGLLRGESTADLRTLTATGASSRVRRALTASTAGALAFVGVVLSIGAAYGALVAAYHADLGKLVPLPLTNLLSLLVGLPLLAMVGGWLLAGREPSTFSRQLTE